jgi:hypothetical protein
VVPAITHLFFSLLFCSQIKIRTFQSFSKHNEELLLLSALTTMRNLLLFFRV